MIDPIKTEPRKLSASWTIETAKDLKNAHGISYPGGKWYNPKVCYERLKYLFKKYILRVEFLEDKLSKQMAEEIRIEMDKIVLEQILKDFGKSDE